MLCRENTSFCNILKPGNNIFIQIHPSVERLKCEKDDPMLDHKFCNLNTSFSTFLT